MTDATGWCQQLSLPTPLRDLPGGRTAAFGTGGGDIELYETATGQRRHTFTGLKRIVNSLAFSPDGATLLSQSPDGPVIQWDVRGDTLHELTPDPAGWDELFRELGGDDAEAAFRAVRRFAVETDGPAELAKRVSKPNALTAGRAVEAVRLGNTAAGRAVLKEWAKGPKGSPLTAAAGR